MSQKTTHGEARGRDIHDGKERALAKQRPTQLSLFQTFLPQDDKYSNTIEFYDAIPKYYTNKRQMVEMREGPEGREIYLPTLEREFKHQGVTYTLEINPARVRDNDGTLKEYRSYWIPGSCAPPWSEQRTSLLKAIEKEGLQGGQGDNNGVV